MNYTLSLTRSTTEVLRSHLLGDRSKEQMAIILCGVNRLPRELRLLGRDVILLPADAFRHQSAARLELKPEVQAFIHQRAHRFGLIQVDWHSHPGSGQTLGFSATDDTFERQQAVYVAHRMGRVPYGSVVVNDDALDGRLWVTQVTQHRSAKDGGQPAALIYRPHAQPLQAVLMGDLQRSIPVSTGRSARPAFVSPIYDRQVRAFGQEFQRQVAGLRVGIAGLGGLGSAVVEHLARLGVQNWVLVDPDVVELSNLNRLVNAAVIDAQKARPKVHVARSAIRQSNPKATVRALPTDVFDPSAQRALKACDLLIAATDNHSSRMALNRLAVQYLIPLLHVGFHVGVGEDVTAAKINLSPARSWEEEEKGERPVTDVSGEFVLPDLGRWCLQCAGIVDPQTAGWELAPGAQKEVLRQRGYIADTPAPAVGHLDGVVAALAAAEVHNLVHAFKPQQRYLVYDALRNELVPLQVTPATHCPVCSPEYGVLGLGDLEPLPDYKRGEQVKLPPLRSANLEPFPPPNANIQAVAPAAPETPASRTERTRRMQQALDRDDGDWV